VYTEDVEVRNRLTHFTETNPEAPLKLGFALLLLTCASLFAQGKQSSTDTAKCLAACNKKCAASMDACKKAAKNDAAIKACQQAYNQCGSICVNKACSAPAK